MVPPTLSSGHNYPAGFTVFKCSSPWNFHRIIPFEVVATCQSLRFSWGSHFSIPHFPLSSTFYQPPTSAVGIATDGKLRKCNDFINMEFKFWDQAQHKCINKIITNHKESRNRQNLEKHKRNDSCNSCRLVGLECWCEKVLFKLKLGGVDRGSPSDPNRQAVPWSKGP